MFKTSHTVKTLAEPEEIWAWVKDVTRWKSWLLGIDMIQLHGPLVSGVEGLMFLSDGKVHRMIIQKYDLGRVEITVILKFGVKMHLLVDISRLPDGSQVKLEGVLFGAMAIFHAWGWGRNLKTGLIPTTRRLGMLGQGLQP
ncbi:MAG: hypothetical protein FWG02_05515 [Holophagaceae bacterium]|nr:hypothetical protein [Holophagaceae bacterium]